MYKLKPYGSWQWECLGCCSKNVKKKKCNSGGMRWRRKKHKQMKGEKRLWGGLLCGLFRRMNWKEVGCNKREMKQMLLAVLSGEPHLVYLHHYSAPWVSGTLSLAGAHIFRVGEAEGDIFGCGRDENSVCVWVHSQKPHVYQEFPNLFYYLSSSFHPLCTDASFPLTPALLPRTTMVTAMFPPHEASAVRSPAEQTHVSCCCFHPTRLWLVHTLSAVTDSGGNLPP